MKKIFIICASILGIVMIALFALASVDFNRVGKDEVFVQITTEGELETFKLDSGEVIETYWYTLPAYDEDGKKTEVTFSAQKQLRQQAYLKLYVKEADKVTSYDEVQLEDIPEKAKNQLN